MSSNMEHKQIGTADGSSEDTGIGVKATANVAVSAVEGQVLLATTVIGLASVGIKVDTQGLVGQTPEEFILLHHAGPQVLDVTLSIFIVAVHTRLELIVSRLPISDLLADS